MNNQITYIPILKWKKGEKDALKELSDNVKNCIAPLIEIVDEKDSMNLLSDLTSISNTPAYIDTIISKDNNRSLLETVLENFKHHNKELYPVIYLSDIPKSLIKIESLVHRIAIRISTSEITSPIGVEKVIDKLNSIESFEKIDIIIDAGSIPTNDLRNYISKIIKLFLSNTFFRSTLIERIIIASTSFPESLSNLKAGENLKVKRFEVDLLKSLVNDPKLSSISKKLIYSDFGVSKYVDHKIDFSKIANTPLPKLKYSSQEYYYILKGSNKPKVSYVNLAQMTLKKDYFNGKNFSFGDNQIYERANKLLGPGNHTNWVTIPTNHHITLIVEQLRNS